MAQGRANGLQGLATAVARALGMGHGDANAPGMAHGGGKGPARGGGGFGFGHASVGNPGHNALSTLSSHSQNTSHKGETHDGRSFSSHSHSTQSLAQHHTDHSNKADQVVQVDDRGRGKEKGFVDSLPPGQEQQADRGMTLNPDTIHSDLDDIVTLGLPPGQELQPDRGLTLDLETINSDLDDVVTRELPPGLELNPDRGPLNPETIHSDPDDIVTGGLPPGLELNLDRGVALNPETIHSDLDDIATGGLPPGLELNLDRGKSLQVSWQAKVAPGTHPYQDTNDTPATEVPRHWSLGDGRAMLRSTNPELDDDDDKWKFVPYFGAVLLFFSWILQNWTRRVTKGKVASLKFEPNALRSIGSVNGEERCKPYGARPPALDKFGAAFSIAGEPQQKVADEKKETLLEHFSGDPDVEEARAEIEHAQEIKEIFHKGFDGIGLG